MELKTNDYKFTNTWFANNKAGWDNLFRWYTEEQKNEIKSVLEIGCYEGQASVYMAENWLKDGTHYHIVDTFGGSEVEDGMKFTMDKLEEEDFIYEAFKHNTSFFPNIGWKVERETSQHMLPLLEREGYKYDFIYVDASHQADDTFVDAYWAHKMLKPNGIIIFDDFGWKDPNRQGELNSPEFGIRAFLTLYQDDYAIIASGYQIALLKKPETTTIKGNIE